VLACGDEDADPDELDADELEADEPEAGVVEEVLERAESLEVDGKAGMPGIWASPNDPLAEVDPPPDVDPLLAEPDPLPAEPDPLASESEPPATERDPPLAEREPLLVEREPLLVEPELLGVANGCGTEALREPVPDDADPLDGDTGGVGLDGVDEAWGVGLAGLVLAGAGSLARGDGDAGGVDRLGDVALAAGLGLAWCWDALARGWGVARGRLAGWDWVAPCGWGLGLAAAPGALADGVLDPVPASYRYRLYWRIRPMRLVP
jgi:hypothetical protein